jgi:ATP-dependent Clp protease ATP-binding subunit ClpA
VFERFTERARQVVVLAQDEARALRHNFIGTEHILLGLLLVEEGLAARVLESLDVRIDETRSFVANSVGQGDEVATGQIPFTPRAKNVLELSLREALDLRHNYIGTEHILLGLVRENSGVASRVLADFGADARTVASRVARLMSEVPEGYVDSFAGEPHADAERPRWQSGRLKLMPRRVATYEDRSAFSPLLLGWILFAISLAIGVFVGWLIWG